MYRISFKVLVNNLVSTLFWSCYGVWLPFSCSWIVWKMFLGKLVTPTVFMWYFRTRVGGTVWSTVGRSVENRLHSVIRWWPLVQPLEDSCRLARASCSFCGGMNGNCRDLLGIELYMFRTSLKRMYSLEPGYNDIQFIRHPGYHHRHKHQGLNPLIRSVSRVTAARANPSSVFQLFSFLWSVVVWFQRDPVLWHSLQVWKPVPSVFIYLV